MSDLSDQREHHWAELTDTVGTDPIQTAAILTLVSREGDRRVLSEWVDDQPGYEVVDPHESVSTVPFDLCVVDTAGFQAHAETILDRRREAAPVLLPVLLLLPAVDSGRLDAAREELGARVLQATVDEVVSLPIGEPELAWRVRTLLRLRSQSLRLRARERELREFHRATEAAGHAVYITDAEGTITYVNPAFERITGFEADAAVGRNPRILRSGEMPEGYYERLWDTLVSGKTWEEEVINRRRDGERYVAQQTIAPILDEAGEVEAFVAVQTDITERKEAEREFRTLVQNLPGVVYRCRNEAGWPMEMVEGDSEAVIGYSAAELVSGVVSYGEDVIAPEDREMVSAHIATAVERDEPFTVVYRIDTRTGERRWVWEKGRVVRPVGETERLEGFITDITDRKTLETELREKSERYESLFASIRDAILVADTDRRITDCNQAFTDLFGYECEEIVGEATSIIYESPAEFERLGEALSDGLEDANVVTVQYQKRSGQVFPGETNVFYLRGADGETQGFIGLIRDVSGRRDRIEQLQVIDRVLRHNLHNDLNVIEGHAQNIREEATGEEEHAADRIVETGEKLLATADKERAITKLLSNRPPQLTLDLVTVLTTVVEDTRDRYPHAEIDVDVPETCEITATPPIETALEELLENAVIHADGDAPRVAVGVETADETATVTVADDGPGIPEMEQDVLSREADIEPLYHGSGLGLWLVNLIVGQSDGVLAFEDNQPRGSAVSITLPLS